MKGYPSPGLGTPANCDKTAAAYCGQPAEHDGPCFFYVGPAPSSACCGVIKPALCGHYAGHEGECIFIADERVTIAEVFAEPTRFFKLDERGQPVPCSTREWAELLDDVRRRQLDVTDVGSFTVSTVFMGMAYPPTMWETAVYDAECCRFRQSYATRKAALAGHRRVVELVEAGQLCTCDE